MSELAEGERNRQHQSRLVGVISDTHGLVRPEALAALSGVDAIVHAGDIGKPEVIDALERIAPVHAVRGNVDRGLWSLQFPVSRLVELGGVSLFVIHNIADLDPAAISQPVRAVISGHSHRPHIERRQGVLYLNPGSAGPRRFTLPVAIARLRIHDHRLDAELVEITPRGS